MYILRQHTLLTPCRSFHILCVGRYKWDKKGATHVESQLKQDRRQITADIMHNGAGRVVAVHMIFGGSTTRCEPLPTVQAKFPKIKFAHSPSHWATHETKVAFVVHGWKWVVGEYASDNNVSLEEAHLRATCILLLDCWKVNLTDKFCDEIAGLCPGMLILTIPAGSTGRYQVCMVVIVHCRRMSGSLH